MSGISPRRRARQQAPRRWATTRYAGGLDIASWPTPMNIERNTLASTAARHFTRRIAAMAVSTRSRRFTTPPWPLSPPRAQRSSAALTPILLILMSCDFPAAGARRCRNTSVGACGRCRRNTDVAVMSDALISAIGFYRPVDVAPRQAGASEIGAAPSDCFAKAIIRDSRRRPSSSYFETRSMHAILH